MPQWERHLLHKHEQQHLRQKPAVGCVPGTLAVQGRRWRDSQGKCWA